jgi:hypothetical protein
MSKVSITIELNEDTDLQVEQVEATLIRLVSHALAEANTKRISEINFELTVDTYDK